MTGGVIGAGLAPSCWAPRRGKYGPDGRVNAIPGHNIPMAMLRHLRPLLRLVRLQCRQHPRRQDLRIGVIATNTMLAGAVGSITAMIYMWLRYGKPDPSMLANGVLAGLVAITAPCAFVTGASAVLIGGIAGVLVCWSVFFVERDLRIDDPVGAISVHGVNGAWGVLSLGLLADGTYGDGWNGVAGGVKGLFYGDAGQFGAQVIGDADQHRGRRTPRLPGMDRHRTDHGRSPVSAETEELGLDCRRWARSPIPTLSEISDRRWSSPPQPNHVTKVKAA